MTASELEVVDELGLQEKQQFPLAQNKRYIVKNGEPLLISTNPIDLITSSILYSKTKLNIIPEPFFRRPGRKNSIKVSDDATHESVGQFFGRHFGKEFVDYLIDPFVAGTSAGDPESLSAPLCNVQDMCTKRGNPFALDFLPKENVKRPLEGFGVLVPSREQENGLRTLGTLFSSMMFPDRAPSDQYLYTTFVGGSRNRALAAAPVLQGTWAHEKTGITCSLVEEMVRDCIGG